MKLRGLHPAPCNWSREQGQSSGDRAPARRPHSPRARQPWALPLQSADKSLTDKLSHRHAAGGFCPIDVALQVGNDTLPGDVGLRVRSQAGNELLHGAVLRAAYSHAALEARIHLRVRLVIDHVQRVAAIDVNAARPAELLPFLEKLSVLVEDLDA